MFGRHSEAAGLRILAFPCNQFGNQEPGTEAEIKQGVTEKYGVKFDMFSKISVNGEEADPLWRYLKMKQGGLDHMDRAIKWNFTKFVVDKAGQPVARFEPKDNPIPKIEEECKKYF